MKALFNHRTYDVIFTAHAMEQMRLRNISEEEVLKILQEGEVKPKDTKGKYWVYKKLSGRKDNLLCLSISIEPPHLIVITTLINWSPK